MAFVNAQHTATTSRTSITRPSPVAADRGKGPNVEITNTGAVEVIIGGDDLTAANGGTSVAAGDSWFCNNLRSSDTIYVITGSSTAGLDILWTGV